MGLGRSLSAGKLEEMLLQVLLSCFVVVNCWPIYEAAVLRTDKGEDAFEDYPVVGVSRRRSFLYRVLRALCVVHSLVPRSVSYVLISSACVLIAEMNIAEALVLNRGEGQR